MFLGCCKRISPKVVPGIEDVNGKYVELNENKKIFVLHYNATNQSSSDVDNIETNNQIVNTQNTLFVEKQGSISQIEAVSPIIPNISYLMFNVNNTDNLQNNQIVDSISTSRDDTNTAIASIPTSNSDNDQIDSEHLGVYKTCLSYLKLSNYKIKYIKNKNDQYGYTMMHRKSIKSFKEGAKVETVFNTSETPLLFFIHGVGGNATIWQKQVNYFKSKGYEIVIPDLLGHGKSSKIFDEQSYQFNSLARDLVNLFDKFKKSKNIIIGHSYGCSFATYLAKIRANVVQKVVLISGGSPYPLDFKSPLLKFPTCLLYAIRPFINCVFFCNAFSSLSTSSREAESSFNIETKILQHTMKGQYWPEGNESFHRSLTQKILIIEGSNDKLVLWEDAFDLFRVVYNSYFVVIENGSHMAIIEQDNLVNESINRFIEDI